MTTLRCQTCGTPDVLVISPGTESLVQAGIVIERGQAQRCWCESHARAAGWPWLVSERTERTGQLELVL